MAVVITVLSNTLAGQDDIRVIRLMPMSVEECQEWQTRKRGAKQSVLDSATKRRVEAVFYECTDASAELEDSVLVASLAQLGLTGSVIRGTTSAP